MSEGRGSEGRGRGRGGDGGPLVATTRCVESMPPIPDDGCAVALASGGQRILGIGAALRIAAAGPGRFAQGRRQAQALWSTLVQRREDGVPAEAGPRLLGGFAFRDQPRADWPGFAPLWFVLPRAMYQSLRGKVYETTVEPAGPVGGPNAAGTEPARAAVEPQGPQGPQDAASWKARAAQAIAMIRGGQLDKVVLARSLQVPACDPVRLFHHLPAQGTHRFLVRPASGAAFVGATPETLVELDGRALWTHAMAGTRVVAKADELGGDPKEAWEHGLVVAHVAQALGRAGAQASVGARRARRVGDLVHLETPVSAQCRQGTDVLEAASWLHPTPAVAGSPGPAALEALPRLEALHRGWYAGAVGWMGPRGEGHLAVALRCGLFRPEGGALFSGAGLVADSVPEAEWEETQAKMRPMLAALEVLA